MRNEMGRPDTRAMRTSRQSSSEGLSTVAQPWRKGLTPLESSKLDLLAPGLVEQVGEGRVRCQVQGEAVQGACDGCGGVVGHGRDLAAVEVAQDHRLEQVVDLLGGEGEVDPGVPLDGTLA